MEISQRRADDIELSSTTSVARVGELVARPHYILWRVDGVDAPTRLRYKVHRRDRANNDDGVFPWLVGQHMRLFDANALWRLVAEVRLDARYEDRTLDTSLC